MHSAALFGMRTTVSPIVEGYSEKENSMQKKVICAGHICLDITPVFDARRRFSDISALLEPGRLIYMNGVSVHTGGSVANTGLAMKLLGNDVRLMGKVGNDAFGSIVRSILSDYGTGGLLVEEQATTSYSVVLAVPGVDRIFLHDPGANDSFTSADIPWDEIGDTALFHFGYPPLMRKLYLNQGEELQNLFRRVKDLGTATSMDLAAVDSQSAAGQADWQTILAGTLPFVDFFVPSFEELCWMLDRKTWERLSARGTDMTDSLDLRAVALPLAEKCISMGCAVVLIKCGTSGMVYQTADTERLLQVGQRLGLDASLWSSRQGVQPCFEADTVRSGTGAGDVSIAAFLTAVLKGETPARCTELAAAEGAASVSSYDALGGILPLETCAERIDAGWKTKER